MNMVIKSAMIALLSALYVIVAIVVLALDLNIIIRYFTFLVIFGLAAIIRGGFSSKMRELDELEKTIFLKASKATLYGLVCLALLLYFSVVLIFDSHKEWVLRINPDLAIGMLSVFAAGALMYAGSLFILHRFYLRAKANRHE